MSKVYDAIELDVQFTEYYVEDAQTPESRHVRARWAVTLKCEDRTMKLDFHTGLRKLKAPRGFDRWFDGSTFIGPRLKSNDMVSLSDIKWRGGTLETAVANYLRAEFKAGCKFVLGYPKEQIDGIKQWVRPEAPTKQDVLYCVASDSQGVEQSRDFEDWAANYGYDADSRKAERIYEECAKQGREFRSLCGGGAQAEDCASFAMAVDEYSYNEAKVMWGEKQAPELPADPYDAVRALGDKEWERLLAMALEILQENHLLEGGEFIFAMGSASFHPAEGAKDSEGFALPTYSTNTDEEWPTDPLKEWLKEWERYVETFGYPGPVRMKADGVRRTDW